MSDFGTVYIVGLGLIGGSIAKTVRNKRVCESVFGYDKDEKTKKFALENGIIDEIVEPYKTVLNDVDFVIFATPCKDIKESLKKFSKIIPKNTIVSDVGSVKRDIVLEGEKFFSGNFVGAHPIAGNEKAGIENSSTSLFEGKPCVVTPTDTTYPKSMDRVLNFWNKLGAKTFLMDPELHDSIYARISHLPHLISFALIYSILKDDFLPDIFSSGGGSIKEFLRLSLANPTIWIDIFEMNRDKILEAAKSFSLSLSIWEDAIGKEEISKLFFYLHERVKGKEN